jgi:hypothetical protein
LLPNTNQVPLNVANDGLSYVKPPTWTRRRAEGEIQRNLEDLAQDQARFVKGLQEYDNLVAQIQDQADLLQAQYGFNAHEINVLNTGLETQVGLDAAILAMKGVEITLRAAGKQAKNVGDDAAEMLPTDVGFSVDATAPARGALDLTGDEISDALDVAADSVGLVEEGAKSAKELAESADKIELTLITQAQGITNQIVQLRQLVRQEPLKRSELYTVREAMLQAAETYRTTLAKGLRILSDRERFRIQTAGQTQQYRYKDMAFRIFRDDALQRYAAQFDLAARYAYLAAKAYDFETALLPGDPRGPGDDFLTGIVRCQAIGLIQNSQPVTGSGTGDPGLADPLARMYQNWSLVLKGQLGFNNPETQTGRFSLRSELFRVQTNSSSAIASQLWRQILTSSIVSNILTLPEFQRYCIPFSPTNPAEPGIVISFPTTITFGQNFFGWPLGGGDNAYDSSHFATKVRSVGVWFANYNSLALANTPYVYLFPVGDDVCRSPSSLTGETRQWKVVDQLLPVPYLNPNTWSNSASWIPGNDMLGGAYWDIRRFASFLAYNDGGTFNPAQVTSSSRLIGRSVWNTRWMLIIPAGTLGSDRNAALQTFVNGPLRDGNGVSDIKIFFQTYSYSGN